MTVLECCDFCGNIDDSNGEVVECEFCGIVCEDCHDHEEQEP